jgi:LuxR family transcriptional regulator, positive regulator of biofilm formation
LSRWKFYDDINKDSDFGSRYILSDNSTLKEECKIYVIGSRGMLNELLIYYLSNSPEPSFNCELVSNLSLLNIKNVIGVKNLVLCNCHDLHEHDELNACARHISTAPEGSCWACFNVPKSQEIAERSIKNGAKGIFFVDDSLANFKKGIQVVLQGDLWFSREILQVTLSHFVRNKMEVPDASEDKGLTKREKEILRFLALGKTNDQIANKLNISILTVKTHVSNIYRKLNVPNRLQAIFWATKNFLILKD